MRRLRRTAFALAAGIAASACGSEKEFPPITYTVQQETPVYSGLGATFEASPRAGTLSVGQVVVAICYNPSTNLGSDTVLVRTEGGLRGLAPILNSNFFSGNSSNPNNSGRTLNNFNETAGDLRAELPTCRQ